MEKRRAKLIRSEVTAYFFWLLRNVGTVVTLVLYTALAPWGYGVFALMTVFPARSKTTLRKRLQTAMRTGFRVTLAWIHKLGLMSVRTPLWEKTSIPTPCVIVANHPCHLDIVGILSWVPDAFTIVKSSIYRQFWLKPLMEGSGQVEGGGQEFATARIIERAVAGLREGQNLVVFPEGTRTQSGIEMPFHRLAFEIACRADVPVVPLRLSCQPSYLSKQRSVLRLPLGQPVFTVEVLETLHPQDFGGSSRKLRDSAQALCFGKSSRIS